MSRANDAADKVKEAIEAFDHGLSIPVSVQRTYSDPEKLDPGKVEIAVYSLTKGKTRHGKAIEERFEVDVIIQRKLAPTDVTNLDAMSDLVEQLDCYIETADLSPYVWQVNDDDDPLWLPERLHNHNTFCALITVRLAIKRPMGE